MCLVCVFGGVSKDNLLELLLLLPPGQIRFRPSDLVAKAFRTELSHQPQESLSFPLSSSQSYFEKGNAELFIEIITFMLFC